MTEPKPRFLIIPEGVNVEVKTQEAVAKSGDMPQFRCPDVTVGNCEILVTCKGMSAI